MMRVGDNLSNSHANHAALKRKRPNVGSLGSAAYGNLLKEWTLSYMV
jgi:hypothetical protein